MEGYLEQEKGTLISDVYSEQPSGIKIAILADESIRYIRDH